MEVNPFRYSGPVGSRDLIGRDLETEQLQRTAEEGNNSRLVAPRRYGKTSVLRRLTDEVRTDGWEAVYVDGGTAVAYELIERIVGPRLAAAVDRHDPHDHKSSHQEAAARNGFG